MAEATASDVEKPRKSRKPILIGLVGAVLFGAGGFYMTFSGLLPLPTAGKSDHVAAAERPDVGFVALEPLTVSLAPSSSSRHLRFAAQLEAASLYVEEVRSMTPRVVDVLNGYLRAVDPAQLEDPALLPLLKAQMLRRVQIVTGEGRVNDLLISEFVLN